MSNAFLRTASLGVLIVLGAANAMLSAQKAETGIGSLAAARRYLEGRWSLTAFDVFPPGKPPLHVTGQGTLTYDQFGNMDVQIRVPKDIVEPLRLAGVETKNGVLSTTGRTAVDMQQKTITYFIAGQPPLGAPSGPLALNRKRYWQVEGDVLTLTTKGDDGQPVSVAKWQKVTKQ
jgi:hypothetical protein